jgi:hypothetical protein
MQFSDWRSCNVKLRDLENDNILYFLLGMEKKSIIWKVIKHGDICDFVIYTGIDKIQ